MTSTTQKYYDLLYTAQGKDYEAEAQALVDLILSHCPHAKTILDVGCGTGRHAKILRERFALDVDGVDLDSEMIAIAQKENPDGHFIVGDMTSFDLKKKYDTVVTMFSAIGYVKTLENVAKALSRFKEHVKDAGIIIVEPWFTPDGFTDGKTFMHTAESEDTQIKVCRMVFNEKNTNISTINFHWTICTPEGIETFTEKHKLGLFTIDEMLSCFEKAGLKAKYSREEGRFSNRGLYIARP